MRSKRQANKQQEIEATDEDTDDTDDADDATPHIWGTLHNQTDVNQALHKFLKIISHCKMIGIREECFYWVIMERTKL